MKKNSETGNTINISNFDELRKCCVAIGEKYKPSNEAITLEALAKLHADAVLAQETVKEAASDLKKKGNERRVIFNTIKPLATRIVHALGCSKAMPGLVRSMRSIVHKIRGTRVKPIAKPDPVSTDPNAKPNTHSVSHQGFTMMIDHVEDMVALLKVIPEYQPNEEDLQITTLTSLLADLKAKDDAASNSENTLNNARDLRDTLLYAPDTGLVDIAAVVKSYTRSIGEKEYRSVSSIYFRNMDAD
jgi:hypothetical protein